MNTEFTIGINLIGDSIWPEPSLSALGEQRDEPVRLHVTNPAVRELYRHNPHITLMEEPGGITLDCSRAWHWAISNKEYFGAAFYEQVGAELRPDSRLEFKLHGACIHPDNTIVLCPFSASCSSHTGGVPNKTMPPEWWEDLTARIQRQLVGSAIRVESLGAADESMIVGTINHRGHPLRLAAEIILASKVLITPETFACVIAGGKTIGHTIVLNGATPASLHISMGMAARGNVDFVWNQKVWEWDMDKIAGHAVAMATKGG